MDGSYEIIQELAVKHRVLAKVDSDDLNQEILVAVLEAKTMSKDEAERIKWLQDTACQIACRLRNKEMAQPHAMDGEVMGEVFAAYDDEPEYEFENCEELVKYERNLKARVKRAVAKLSVEQQQVIKDKYLSGKQLSKVAADSEMCDSSHRTRLYRAKLKLKSMIDHSGYALAC